MTLHEVAKQLHSISNGRINGEQFGRRALETVLAHWLRDPEREIHYILEAELPDGRWMVDVERRGPEFDYWIPDTREQEEVLFHRLGIGC